MENKQINVSLEKARKWYREDNKTLKELALSVFSREELISDYSEILSSKGYSMTSKYISCPSSLLLQVEAISKLHSLALAMNEGWHKTVDSCGYYIALKSIHPSGYEAEWCIQYQGIGIVNAGIAYFKNEEDAKAALEVAKREKWLEDLI